MTSWFSFAVFAGVTAFGLVAAGGSARLLPAALLSLLYAGALALPRLFPEANGVVAALGAEALCFVLAIALGSRSAASHADHDLAEVPPAL